MKLAKYFQCFRTLVHVSVKVKYQ